MKQTLKHLNLTWPLWPDYNEALKSPNKHNFYLLRTKPYPPDFRSVVGPTISQENRQTDKHTNGPSLDLRLAASDPLTNAFLGPRYVHKPTKFQKCGTYHPGENRRTTHTHPYPPPHTDHDYDRYTCYLTGKPKILQITLNDLQNILEQNVISTHQHS